MIRTYARYLLVLLSVLLVTGAAIATTPKAYAMSTYVDCGATCYAWTGWNGTTYGGYGYVGTTGVGVPLYKSDATLQRFLAVWGGTEGADVNSNIHAGEEVDQPATGLCNLSGNSKAAYFFVYSTTTSGLPDQTFCWAMPNSDANHPMGIQINPYTSNGGGMLIHIYGYADPAHAAYISYASGIAHSFASMGYQEEITDNVSGHEVWGVYEEYSEYVDSGGGFHYQFRSVDFRTAFDPPQMYWTIPPNGQNSGGQAISCDYESGSSCTFGS